jgi:hypothetical protein
MQKLEMIHKFHKLYGQQINSELVSIKYVQNNNKAMIEMYFNGALKPNIIDLKFIGGDIIFDENGEPEDLLPLFDPSEDIVDNAKRLIEMDDYSLINCIDDLFSEVAAHLINEQYLKK